MKRAFTLAEVLITLGIIGLVMSMTLPVLVGKYKMKTFEVAFKKQYSTLQNAINTTTAEYGITGCYVYYPKGSEGYLQRNEDCELLEERLITILNLKEYSDDIKDKYPKAAEIQASGGASVNWSCSYDNTINNADIYISNDGTIFIFRIKGYPKLVGFDVNGEKGPNKWGYDVFFMGLSNHNHYEGGSNMIFLTDEFCSLIDKGGKFPRTILRNQEYNTDKQIVW